jgi:hypothetical protein
MTKIKQNLYILHNEVKESIFKNYSMTIVNSNVNMLAGHNTDANLVSIWYWPDRGTGGH